MFKEAAEHAHVQGFPKTVGTGKEIHFSLHIEQFLDEHCLIYEIVSVLDYFFEVVYPDRQWYPPPCKEPPFQI